MSTAIDPQNSIVVWSMGDALFLYNWTLDRWTMSDLALSIVFPGFVRDISLEELDGPYPVMDTMPPSMDDPMFRGGDPRFYVIDTANRIGVLSGTPLAAELRLVWQETTPGRTARFRWVRPISDVETLVTTVVETSDRLGATSLVNNYSGITGSGDVAVRDRGRFAKVGFQMAAGSSWSFMQGVDIVVERGAKR